MTFHSTCVNISFSSIWVAQWPHFGKQLLTRLTICSLCILTICKCIYFLFWFFGLDLGSDCFSSRYLHNFHFYRKVANGLIQECRARVILGMRTFLSSFFMKPPSYNNQVDTIEAFNSTSRYLIVLLDIDNPYFEGMVNRIYPPELQLNKAIASDTYPPFWTYIYLFLMTLF